MKLKALALVAAVLMTATCFAACGTTDSDTSSTDTSSTSNDTSSTGDSTGDDTASTEHQQIEVTSTPVTTLDYTATSLDTSDAVELVWYCYGDEPEDGQDVYAALNEMSAEDINTTVDFRFADGTKAGLIVSTDEPYDMIFTCSWQLNYVQYASKGVFAELEDYLPTASPTLYNFIPELVWEGATINGHIYCVPNYKDSAAAIMWCLDKSLVEDAGLTDADLDTLTDDPNTMTPLLQALKDNTDLEGCEAPFMLAGSINFTNQEFDYITRDFAGIGIPYESTDNKVVSVLENDLTMRNLKVATEWYQKGLINQDNAATDTVAWQPVFVGQGWLNCEQFWYSTEHGERVIRTKNAAVYSTDSILGACNAISVNSENVERALLYFQWLNCNSTARTMYCYGIEGTHWNYTDEGTVERTAEGSAKYQPSSFSQGTFFTVVPESPKSLDSWDGLLESCVNATATPLLGYTPDLEEYNTQIAALSTAWSEYSKVITTGNSKDLEADVASALDALYAAGLQTVIDGVQAQVDEFLASK
jgi:putative aldouronate transport system substrate-binding protein